MSGRPSELTRRSALRLAASGAAAAVASGARALGMPDMEFAIRAGTLYTATGPPIRNGVVLTRGRQIVAVGQGLPIPAGFRVLSAAVAMPGLVDAHSYLGCYREIDEPLDALTPDLRARDAFDPADPCVARAAFAGVTTCCIMPGNGNAMAGIGTAFRLGAHPEVLRDYAAQKLSMSAAGAQRNPTSRAGVIALIRAALDGARRRQAVSSVTQTDLLAGFPTRLGQRVAALAPILSGERPVFVHAPRADDVENALGLFDAYRLRGCLLHASEAFELRDEIARRRLPVVLGPLGFDDTDRTLANAGKLASAGIPVAFCSDAPLADPGSLRLSASLAADRGLSADEALRAITRNPADLLSLGRRVGSLAPGMDADILLLNGDPLALTSRALGTLCGGLLRLFG